MPRALALGLDRVATVLPREAFLSFRVGSLYRAPSAYTPGSSSITPPACARPWAGRWISSWRAPLSI
ncbi:MAG: hypothetical protein HC842_04955 [Cytophagales bacterium]|nr:hypothetical protein [Cytophagales bacterium]